MLLKMNLSNCFNVIILMSSFGFGLVLSESCSVADAKNSLKLAIQVLDLVKENCRDEPFKINPFNCADLLTLGFTTSGVYQVYPRWSQDKKPFEVFCDQETDGGGWTVFQRRIGSGENFNRNWADYKNGFGNLKEDFWLGNDYISLLTTQDRMQLRVDLEDFENEKRYATYNNFLVLDETNLYLMTLREYNGNAGDAMKRHNGYAFATFDKDDVNNCSAIYKGGWWYNKCHLANLNGLYLKGKHDTYAVGVNWEPFKGYHYSLKTSEMKIRPQYFDKNSMIPL